MAGLRIFVYAVVGLMLLPVLITFPVALTAVPRISFPPTGLSGRWFMAILSDDVLLSSMVRSFWLAVAAAIVAIVIALPCAFVIQRGKFRGRDVIETIITGPRMIPQIVLALALLIYFETIGERDVLVGQHCDQRRHSTEQPQRAIDKIEG